MKINNTIASILDVARWAPSGDNTQPWRFEIVDDTHFVVHGHDTRDWCVYDLDGRASQLAIGALLENIAIAASDQGIAAEFSLREHTPDHQPTTDVHLAADEKVRADPLSAVIEKRVTQRRPMSTSALSNEQKNTLEKSVGDNYEVTWIEDTKNRWRMARLLSQSAKLRLTIPEAYEVHSRIIEWNSRFSEDRIPDEAVGLDPISLKLMRWAMVSWERVDALNKYFAGTWLPRLQLDIAPGFFCGAHFLISSVQAPSSVHDYISGGRAMQRFWLATTKAGLQFQPEMTPLIFSRYATAGTSFSKVTDAKHQAASIGDRLKGLFGATKVNHGMFMGRVGLRPPPSARSTRTPLARLLLDNRSKAGNTDALR